MRIVVCVKHVPDLQSDRRYEHRRTLRSATDGTLNEVDENAVEQALSIPGADVTALTMGPAHAVDALRRALAMGADRGVHLCDEALAGSDYAGTTRALAAAIGVLETQEPVDLVLTGLAALDGLGAVVPAMLAAALGRPHLGVATEVEVSPGQVTVVRDLGERTETVQAALPAVVSVTDMSNSPRFPQFQDLLAARDKPVQTWTLAEIGLRPEQVGLAGAHAVVRSADPAPEREEPLLITDDDGDAAELLVDYLQRHDLIGDQTR